MGGFHSDNKSNFGSSLMRVRNSILMLCMTLFAFAGPANAMVVTAELTLDNNGVVLTDPNEIIDVSATQTASGWSVTVDGGLSFEEFFFNYDTALAAGDVVATGASVGDWTSVASGGTAGNFGQFSFKLDGPGPGGVPSLTFDILVAGMFVANADNSESIFAAKISSEQGGNAGGFVSANSVSAVPLPGAVWLFISAMMGLMGIGYSRRGNRT
jgi:hypothetical protein